MNQQCYSNESIQITLKVIAQHGPLNLADWAALATRHAIPATRGFLLRLHRTGLLNRYRDAANLPLYSISARGIDRLAAFKRGNRIPTNGRTGAK